MVSELQTSEALELMREDIMALLSQDPHHYWAQVLGQHFLDLIAELNS